MTIAGHFFSPEGVCSCGKRFSDISTAAREHIGQSGWAHSAHLTISEYGEIVAERERIWALVSGSASGGAGTVEEQ